MVENLECRRFRNRLDAYVDETLSASEREEMQRHAATCPTCGKLLEEYQDLLTTLHTMDEELTVPPEVSMKWRSVVRDEAVLRRKGHKNGWLKTVCTIAATVAVLLCVTSIYRNNDMPWASGKGNIRSDMAYMEGNGTAYYNEMPAETADTGDSYVPGMRSMMALETDGNNDTTTIVVEKPRIIYTGSRTIQSENFDEDLQAIDALVSEQNAWYAGKTVSGKAFSEGGRGRSLSATVRVPTGNLDSFLSELSEIGFTTKATDSSQDISAQYSDVQGRLATLRLQYDRLNSLITDAADLTELIQLEDKLYQVRYEIESLEGQLRSWDSTIEYATVTVSLTEVERIEEPVIPPQTLGERVSEGFRNSIEWVKGFLQDMVVALATFSPALVVLVPAAVIIILIVRSIKKRRKRRM